MPFVTSQVADLNFLTCGEDAHFPLAGRDAVYHWIYLKFSDL